MSEARFALAKTFAFSKSLNVRHCWNIEIRQTHTRTYIHTYIRTYVCTYVLTYAHTDIHTNTHTHIHTNIHTDRHTYIHTFTCIYNYIYIYIFIYKHRTYVQLQSITCNKLAACHESISSVVLQQPLEELVMCRVWGPDSNRSTVFHTTLHDESK